MAIATFPHQSSNPTIILLVLREFKKKKVSKKGGHNLLAVKFIFCCFPRHTIEDYIEKALKLVIVRPSTSLVEACFLFIENKVGHRPCIDYRGLNAVTVKYSHSFPLSNTKLVLYLCRASVVICICEEDELIVCLSIIMYRYIEYLMKVYGVVSASYVF